MKASDLKFEQNDMVNNIVSMIGLDPDCVFDLIDKFGLVCKDYIQKVERYSEHVVHVVTNKNDDYFIGLNLLNYVEFIREKSLEGNLIYVDI